MGLESYSHPLGRRLGQICLYHFVGRCGLRTRLLLQERRFCGSPAFARVEHVHLVVSGFELDVDLGQLEELKLRGLLHWRAAYTDGTGVCCYHCMSE